MAMLKQFDVELLVGQVSYKQKAYIYNLSKGYDITQKECTTINKIKEPSRPPIYRYEYMYIIYEETILSVSVQFKSPLYLCKCSAHTQCQEMDRRQLGEGHLKYACLQLAAQYPEVANCTSITKETELAIKERRLPSGWS